jgi:glutamyl-Q tRNA(Asp) synthetase
MNSDSSTVYRGRFAPSPTGPLHFGSLVAAVGSYLDARSRGGEWRVRIEDLDPPREIPGAASMILQTLENFELFWDGSILYQSQRNTVYADAIDQLQSRQQLFPCACSRKEITDSALAGPEGPIYPGTCRQGLPDNRQPRALRVRVSDRNLNFRDRLQGNIEQNLARDIGDFIVRRADGIYAYQLAVVVDDALQGITHVVRGSDLLLSTTRQIYLQELLGYLTPEYLHLPTVVNSAGEKLSKQTYAEPLDVQASRMLAAAVLRFLNQSIPADFSDMTLSEIWSSTAQTWDPQSLPAVRSGVPPDLT